LNRHWRQVLSGQSLVATGMNCRRCWEGLDRQLHLIFMYMPGSLWTVTLMVLVTRASDCRSGVSSTKHPHMLEDLEYVPN
jgi:hypothetical protein